MHVRHRKFGKLRVPKSIKGRKDVLATLGFKSYKQYLFSSLWKRIRDEVMARDDGTCACGERATVVHHKDYTLKTLSGESLRSLFALCDKCHVIAHKPKKKRGTPATQEAFNAKKEQKKLDRIAYKRRQQDKMQENWTRVTALDSK